MESESGCEEVLDHGQEDMSLRWVIKEKAFDNEKLVQPRLCSNMFYRRIASIFQVFLSVGTKLARCQDFDFAK